MTAITGWISSGNGMPVAAITSWRLTRRTEQVRRRRGWIPGLNDVSGTFEGVVVRSPTGEIGPQIVTLLVAAKSRRRWWSGAAYVDAHIRRGMMTGMFLAAGPWKLKR